MTTPAPAIDLRTPLVDLLGAQLSPDRLRQLIGAVGEAVPATVWRQALGAPLESVLGSPGKGFRARLVATSYALAGGRGPLPAEIPALLEILHAGSLVVDDIEDDSESRRGAPALHVTYGTPVALNAGNWLYFWALHLIEGLPLDDARQLAMLRRMTRAMLACHFGQALDLTVMVDQLARADVPLVVSAATRLKTGRLMQLAAEVGAVAAGADAPTMAALADFGCHLGVGLQMLDDVGGITSERRRHKGFEDLRLGRLTWPWAWVAEGETDVAYARLRELGRDVRTGRAPAERLATRLQSGIGEEARKRVHAHLTGALGQLAERLGTSEQLSALGREIERLEQSYD
jgi:geranylgeranyl pyrophosphate synthase